MTPSSALFLLDLATLAPLWFLMRAAGLLQASHPVLLLYPTSQLACLYALGLYRRDMILETRRALARLPLALGLSLLVPATIIFFLHLPQDPLLSAGLAAASATLARLAFHILRRHGLFRRRILVVGAGRRAWDLAWMLSKEGRILNYELTFLHDPAWAALDPRLATASILPVHEPILAIAQRLGTDEIVVAPDERRGMDLQRLLDCKIEGFPIRQYLTFVETEIRRVDLKRMELSWLLYSDGFYFGLLDRILKRLLDIAVSATALLLLFPFLAAAMFAIKLGDRGPVLYRQERITRGGRAFRITKLRTMRPDAEAAGIVWAANADPRVTRVGNLLRRTRFDELPQLYDVLTGRMSLVGPRPERPAFVHMLTERIPLYPERHTVRAGLTGWAQINYPYGASIDDARSKLSYDLYYVKNFSILFDLQILIQTIRVVLWPDTAATLEKPLTDKPFQSSYQTPRSGAT